MKLSFFMRSVVAENVARGSPSNGAMSIVANIRRAIKDAVFAGTLLPQEFTIGVPDPQAEIAVWLHGMDEPRDVTLRQSTACSSPFVLCVAFDKGKTPTEKELKKLSLKFRERQGRRGVLGEIRLKLAPNLPVISTLGSDLFFFEARSSSNYCLPGLRLGAHYLFHAHVERHTVNSSGVEMSFLERRAAMVTFIRPHPISLVSAVASDCQNIFTMNIMGDLGYNRFAFALKDSRTPAHIVERAGRIALSTVPLSQARFVFELAANHYKQTVEWGQLAFQTKRSVEFQIPVPVFASRVREMEVEKIQKIGSHTLFIARIISDETFTSGEIVCAIHGFYQARRLKGRPEELRSSLVQHYLNKQGS
jgi:flavin reductase (DIM6/NTAB) family NADH-FMN oxidoreductase RutF